MKYPEHEKLEKIRDKSQLIGEFLEWLNEEQHLFICEEDTGSYENAFVLFSFSNEVLLARYFDIDLDKLEQEKRQMLKELRKEKS